MDGNSWATAGYSGAIASGKITCGLLIGRTNAIGLYYDQKMKGRLEKNVEDRGKAIQAVNELERFGASDCRTINKINFQDGE